MSDDANDRAAARAPIALFAVIFLVIAGDMLSDWAAGTSLGHLLAEMLVLGASAWGLLHLLRRLGHLRGETVVLGWSLRQAEADAERWRAEARDVIRGLGEAMAEQFHEWSFTPAEQEVALLLVKGLSLKEAAQVRGTSERTVRQQALGVYRKAGVAGRAELSAFFLEDLLLPLQTGTSDRRSRP